MRCRQGAPLASRRGNRRAALSRVARTSSSKWHRAGSVVEHLLDIVGHMGNHADELLLVGVDEEPQTTHARSRRKIRPRKK